jgi:hypothetical protein
MFETQSSGQISHRSGLEMFPMSRADDTASPSFVMHRGDISPASCGSSDRSSTRAACASVRGCLYRKLFQRHMQIDRGRRTSCSVSCHRYASVFIPRPPFGLAAQEMEYAMHTPGEPLHLARAIEQLRETYSTSSDPANLTVHDTSKPHHEMSCIGAKGKSLRRPTSSVHDCLIQP